MVLIKLILLLLTAGYFYLFIQLIQGWNLLKPIKNQVDTSISIIIPFKDESKNLPALFKSLSGLNISTPTEVIFIDDHSQDDGAFLVSQFIAQNPKSMKLLQNPSHIIGKRQSIAFAVSKAEGEWLIQTDADVTFGPEWLNSMVSCISNDVSFVSGPVSFNEETGFFKRWTQLEFLSLIGIGAASIGLKSPFLSNGANLLAKRAVVEKAYGVQRHQEYPGGDDIFLLQHVVDELGPEHVAFAHHPNAIVSTHGPQNVAAFIEQRKRWASKNTKVTNTMFAVQAGVVIFNLLLVLTPLIIMWDFSFLKWTVTCFILKAGIETLFYIHVLPFFKQSKLLKYHLLGQPFHMLYVISGAIWAFKKEYTWKSRNWNHG